MKRVSEEERLSEEQIRLVLQRAAEIDGRGRSLSVAELRSVASEAGIPSSALSEALAEVLLADAPRSVQDREAADDEHGRRFRDIRLGWREARVLLALCAGASFGALAPEFWHRHEAPVFGSLGMFIASLLVALLRRKDPSDEAYVKSILPAWIGYLVAFTLNDTRIGMDPIEIGGLTLAAGALSTALGVAISRWAFRWRNTPADRGTINSASFSGT